MGAQGAEAECIVAFGEADAGVVEHQRAMIERGQREAEGAIEKKLPGGREQEVSAANDFGDLHGGIVCNHGELIGGNIVRPPDNEIAKVFAGGELLRTKMAVGERNDFTIGHAEPPTELGFWNY